MITKTLVALAALAAVATPAAAQAAPADHCFSRAEFNRIPVDLVLTQHELEERVGVEGKGLTLERAQKGLRRVEYRACGYTRAEARVYVWYRESGTWFAMGWMLEK